MNPLDTIKGTIIAGFVLAVLLSFVVKFTQPGSSSAPTTKIEKKK